MATIDLATAKKKEKKKSHVHTSEKRKYISVFCHRVTRCSRTLTWCPGRASAPCIQAARGRPPWRDRLWSLRCGGPFVRWAGRRAAWQLLDNCENSHRQGDEARGMFRVTGILNESLKIKPISCQMVFKETESLFKVWNSDWDSGNCQQQSQCLVKLVRIKGQTPDSVLRWVTHWLASRRTTLTPSTVTWVFMGRMWTYCSATFSLVFTRLPVIWERRDAASGQQKYTNRIGTSDNNN